MKVLAVGDICAPDGSTFALKAIPQIKHQENIDLVIVNGENSAAGNGITPHSADTIFAAGADVITGGNHTFRRKEFYDTLETNPFTLRPHNLKEENIGGGYCLVDMGRCSVAVINLMGQIYLERTPCDNPFKCADTLIEKAKADGAKYIFVDFHAEATSEKRAMGFYLDGKVTAVFGTHTHVQTADAQILPQGTGYITDLGMTGVINSILGVKNDIIINRLRDGDQSRFEQESGKCMLNGCIFETDDKTGLTKSVKRIYIM
ncbi:MAG: TIGR00282 family metallophosphoesterase [Clostridia bacterium]|nr:TIGR00282 family metallophosphoesterase [Clostridia bacterium]